MYMFIYFMLQSRIRPLLLFIYLYIIIPIFHSTGVFIIDIPELIVKYFLFNNLALHSVFSHTVLYHVQCNAMCFVSN